ncbi:MAG: TetR/AcrR family transcriptional regulator [Chloroflexota bacterium]
MSDRPYHHGDLREALVTAGVARARTGGPGAIGIRTLAASVGVSPTAAYRHFADLDAIVAAVAQRAREVLARRMQDAIDGVAEPDPRERAWARLRAAGRAYVLFAADAPELFATAFAPCPAVPARPDDPDAWRLLLGVLDELAALGELRPIPREEAAVVAWSAAHGLAGITAMGCPPHGLDPRAATEAMLDAVRRGLAANDARTTTEGSPG